MLALRIQSKSIPFAFLVDAREAEGTATTLARDSEAAGYPAITPKLLIASDDVQDALSEAQILFIYDLGIHLLTMEEVTQDWDPE